MRPALVLVMTAAFWAGRAIADEPRDPWTTVVDWKEISQKFAIYLDHPTPRNAAAVSAVLPATHAAMGIEAIAGGSVYDGLPLLERDVEAAIPEAVRLAFDLYSIADGGFLEDLDVLLGRLIRVDPEAFLRELQRRPRRLKEPGGLLLNLGDPFVDRVSASCVEIDKRYVAIESVRQTELQAAKNQCLEILKAAREACNELPNQLQQKD